jgi:hypothetical protein
MQPPAWQRDRDRSAKLMPAIKRILGEHLITEAPPVEDQEHNTDLMVLYARPMRIGCRVRRMGPPQYLGEFTIRVHRAKRQTEFAKIMEGWGDFFFYGFANPEHTELLHWFLGDLNVFRYWMTGFAWPYGLASGDWKGSGCPCVLKYNRMEFERSPSCFLVFRLADCPRNFVLASSADAELF